jgi:hypothetical protein
MKGSVAKWSDWLPPKCLWDNCLEREAYVRSFTAHDIYKLNGQVPETVVSGKTAAFKESNPKEVAEFAMAKGVNEEAAFIWWVPNTLKRRNRGISRL